jgi:DNA-binding MarR family transcriptional regulator
MSQAFNNSAPGHRPSDAMQFAQHPAAARRPLPAPTLLGRTESEMPGLTLAECRSWQHFLDASLHLTTVLNRRLTATHDLTLDDVRLLHLLSLSPDHSARMGTLADQLHSTASRLTRQLARLERRGLAARERCADDGRGVMATITEQGCRVVDESVLTYGDAVRSHYLDHMTRAQAIAMSDYCRRLIGK